MRLVVEAEVENRLVAVRAVEEALVKVEFPVTFKVPPKMPLPVVVKLPT